MARILGKQLLQMPVFIGIAAILTFFSCKPAEPDTTSLKKEIVTAYAQVVFATYEDALTTAKLLQTAVDTFLNNPTELNLKAAQKSWKTARAFYGQTEVFRFYDGPIDNGETGVEGLLNAWPLDEVYVDYVVGEPNAGIINKVQEYPEITRELLVSLNEKGGEENISCGYHAIEFMLWGQDVSDKKPGQRPYTDFIPGTVSNDRRRTFLQLNTSLLIEHLTKLCDAWQPGKTDNYAAKFLSENPDNALQKILTGMGVLSKVEMAGERMFTAYDNASQEDEQSCFSDNTKADLQNNIGGIINAYFGNYVRFDKSNIQSAGIDDLVRINHPELADSTELLLKKCNNDIQNIYYPFDQAIVLENKREQVMKAILTTQQLGEQFSIIASTLGITINVNAAD
jgi:putative iron-regulated protein